MCSSDLKIDIIVATKIENLTNIVSVISERNHSFFLDVNGQVWGTGSNSYGQLGLGDRINRLVPSKIENLPKICIKRKIPTKNARKIVE